MACCPVGDRPDVKAIDRALLTGSIRRVVKDTGLSRHSLTKHLKECLGAAPLNAPLGAATVAAMAALSPATVATKGPDESEHPETGAPTTAATNEPKTPPDPAAVAVTALYSPRYGHPRVAKTEEQRVAFLCDLIETNRFYFRRTLDGLAEEWGEDRNEVRRMFFAARAKNTADRQNALAQLEVTISALESQERQANREYFRLRKEQPAVAKGYLQLAVKIRGDIAEFAGLRKLRMEADINVWTRPEFVTAVDQITDASLGILLPGTEQDEHGMAALCGRVEQSLGTTLTDRERTLISEALAQAAAVVDERIVQIVAEASGKNAQPSGEPLDAE